MAAPGSLLPPHIRRPHLLRDINCLDASSEAWFGESPFPPPPAHLDGATASIVGSKLFLIAGGSYPEHQAPDSPFSLACSRYVFMLDLNPPCNADGSIPPFEWKAIRSVDESQDDLHEYIEALNGHPNPNLDPGMVDADPEEPLEDDEFDDERARFLQALGLPPAAPAAPPVAVLEEDPVNLAEVAPAVPPEAPPAAQSQADSSDDEDWESAEGDEEEPPNPREIVDQLPRNGANVWWNLAQAERVQDLAQEPRPAGNIFEPLRHFPFFAGQNPAPGPAPGPAAVPADNQQRFMFPGQLAAEDIAGPGGRLAGLYQRFVHLAGNIAPIRRFIPNADGEIVPGLLEVPLPAFPTKPTLRPRVWHSSTVVGNRIYIIGGRDIRLMYFGDVTYFDTETETFVRVKFPPGARTLPPRAAHGAVCPDGRHIYVFGGRYKHNSPAQNRGLTHRHYNDLWVFDTRSETWKCLINPPEQDPEKYLAVSSRPCQLAKDEEEDDFQDDEVEDEFAEYEYDISGKKRRKGANTESSVPKNEKKPKTADKSFSDYPAPRCCFVMVLDPDLPHKAHIIGGYTSSNICFYYISDAWTLDLLELSWTRLSFKAGSRLSRVSIHVPTCYYDEVVLFAGEGSQDVGEIAYKNQHFLNETKIFTPPATPLSAILRYRDPIAHKYYKMLKRRDLSDVTLDIPQGCWHLHRVVVASRMKELHVLIDVAHEAAQLQASSASLHSSTPGFVSETNSSSSSLPFASGGPSTNLASSRSRLTASFGSSTARLNQSAFIAPGVIVSSAPVSAEIWNQWIVASMPLEFFETFTTTKVFDEVSSASNAEDAGHHGSAPSSFDSKDGSRLHAAASSVEKVAAGFFDAESLDLAFVFAYTDVIQRIQKVPMHRLVQLYHLGFILGLRRLSAVVLVQIGERLDPFFPLYSNRILIAQMIATTLHFEPDAQKLVNVLLWHHRNANFATKFETKTFETNVSKPLPRRAVNPDDADQEQGGLEESESPKVAHDGYSADSSDAFVSSPVEVVEQVTPSLHLAFPRDMTTISPIGDIAAVANEWLAHGGKYATLPVAMENGYLSLQNESVTQDGEVIDAPYDANSDDDLDAGVSAEADFVLYLPQSNEEGAEATSEEGAMNVSSPEFPTGEAHAPFETNELTLSSLFPTAPATPTSQPIRVHKSILIFSSPYLRGLLSDNFREAQQGFALLQDLPYPMERASLGALVQFMYSGSCNHIVDKNVALDILCNVPFFFTQLPELTKPIPHLGVRSTRMLRPRCIELELMIRCMDVVLSGEVAEDEFQGLMELAKVLALVQFDQRINTEMQKRIKHDAA